MTTAAQEKDFSPQEALPVWRLDDLYPGPDSAPYGEDFEGCLRDAAAFEARYKGKLGAMLEEGEAFARAIGQYEALSEQLGRIMAYASLAHAAESEDPAVAKRYGDAHERVTAASSHLLFFTLEINKLDDKALARAMETSSEIARYRPWLEDLAKDKPFQLEDRIEQLFHDKSMTGHAAWTRLFDETIAGLRFNVEGEMVSLEVVFDRLQDADRQKRADAAAEITRVLQRNGRLFTLITNTLAKDKQISDQWRGFEDVADSRHLANRVEPEVVDALVSAVSRSFPEISHRYYAMKAKWLGLDRLKHWDRNAPLPFSVSERYSWGEARQLVLEAYGNFAPEMADIAQRFFTDGWIDAPVRPGKRGGAFAHPTVPSAHPYVLVNYQGRPRDVMTLAHELGHGVHQVLAARQGALMAQTPLTLAETASVFGEMLTFRHMLEQCADEGDRKAMLAQKVEDMINTVVRQIAFYQFERKVHEARREGEITQETLGEFWMSVQEKSLGPIFDLDDDYRIYWSYVPHFIHSPFYVYAYAFGDCLVNSLYGVFQASEEGFRERYFDMLKAGGTKHHGELLAPFGLDASDPAFWDRGLGVIKGLIEELERYD